MIIEVREGDAASEKRMAEAVQTCQHLYKRMRESMSDRAELMLQMQSRTIEQAVESLLSNETRKLEELIQPHFVITSYSIHYTKLYEGLPAVRGLR